MLNRPSGISDESVAAAVRQGWGLQAASVEHLVAGFGSHHWRVAVADGSACFVTVDDLRAKDFLGRDAEKAFDSLRSAFTVAYELHHSGLEWVVAPLVDVDGAVLRRLDEHYSIALFPYLDGEALEEYASEAERGVVVSMLTKLPGVPDRRRSLARRETYDLPNRGGLLAAIEGLNERWVGGSFSEPARHLLRQHQAGVGRILSDYDYLAAQACY